MAKQTFTTGQVLTAAQLTDLQQTAMLGGAANARTASYVLVAGDAGNAVTMDNVGATTITVNTGIFAAGDIVTIINLGAGTCTITAGTATVVTSGSLALTQNQGGVLRFNSSGAAIFLQFATPASGDITEVTTASTSGLTGGATSGAVALRLNTTAKGSLLVGSGATTLGELTVGADHGFLQALASASTGTQWNAGAWTTYTPGFTASSGTFTTTTVAGRYIRIGRFCAVAVDLQINNIGTASGTPNFTLPFTQVNANSKGYGVGREVAFTGKFLHIRSNTNSNECNIFQFDGNAGLTGASSGWQFQCNLVYEVA